MGIAAERAGQGNLRPRGTRAITAYVELLAEREQNDFGRLVEDVVDQHGTEPSKMT